MAIDERQLLRRVWLFGQLDDADLDLIVPLARERAYPARKVLVQQGDAPGDLFAVIQGRLQASSNLDGEETLLSILGPGEVFGEIALLDGAARSATVSAIESCRLLVLPREPFQRLLLDIPRLAVRLLAVMAKRVRALTARAEESLLLDVPTRLAKAILDLGRFGVPAGGDHTRITVRLSQQQLGNLIGATREMVNRCLGRFARRGMLRHRLGVLTILDAHRLRAVADGAPLLASVAERRRRGRGRRAPAAREP